MVRFSKKEMRVILTSAVVLGIVFGYDDGSMVFRWGNWMTNMIRVTLLCLASVVMYEVGHKVMAKKRSCTSRVQIWGRGVNGPPQKGVMGVRKNLPMGVILPLICTVASGGAIKLAATTTTEVTSTHARRVGREFPKVSEREEAEIAVAGPMTAIVIALLAKGMLPFLPLMGQVIVINKYLALMNMLPIPTLDGVRVYFGSPLLFTCSWVFIVVMVLLINALSPMAALTLSAGIAAAAVFVHYQTRLVG